MRFDGNQKYFVNIRASSQEHFETAMSLAFNGKYVTARGDYGDFGLVYYWFSSTFDVYEPPILKTLDDRGRYVLHHPKDFIRFSKDECVGDMLDSTWKWVCKHPYNDKGEWGFEITTDPGDNHIDILCIVRRTYEEYHYE